MLIAAFLCCLVTGNESSSLELTLEVANSVVKAVGVLLVKARVANHRDERVNWPSKPSFANNDFWLEVRELDRPEFVKCHTLTAGDEFGSGPMSLEPGKGMSHKKWQLALATLEQIEEPSQIVFARRQGCKHELERARTIRLGDR